MRICEIISALAGPPDAHSVPGYFPEDWRPSPLLKLLRKGASSPDKPSALNFAIGWIKDRAGISWADANNYAERAIHGFRWGPWKPFEVSKLIDEIAAMKAERAEGPFRDIPSVGERALLNLLELGGTLPSVESIAKTIDMLDRQDAGDELAANLWLEYPADCLKCGIAKGGTVKEACLATAMSAITEAKLHEPAALPLHEEKAAAQKLPPEKEVPIAQVNSKASEVNLTARTLQKKQIVDVLGLSNTDFKKLIERRAIVEQTRQAFAFDFSKFSEPDRKKLEAKLSDPKPGRN